MYCEKCKHEFCWVCLKQYTSDHFSKGWCSQFGTVPGLYFVKRVGRAVISKILEIDSNSTESEQDQENIFEKIGYLGVDIEEKFNIVKKDIDGFFGKMKTDMDENLKETKEKNIPRLRKIQKLVRKKRTKLKMYKK